LDAVKNIDLKLVPYPHSAGIESYRKKLTGYYTAINIPLTENDIIITTGGSEAVQIAFQVCCNQGDEVIVMEPFYTNYNTFALLSNLKLVPITNHKYVTHDYWPLTKPGECM
jgi:aspartate aminotransferase